MKMWVVVTIGLLPIALGYIREYKAFDDCGVRGWSCSKTPSYGMIVTYRCTEDSPNARIWWWTARIPSVTTSLRVENCDHVEVHPDCTAGYRSYTMQDFQAIDVKHLEILSPLKPRIFLHDNEQSAQAPPTINLVRVQKLTHPPNLFDKASGRCRTKGQVLDNLNLDSVNLEKLESDFFKYLNLSNFTLSNVTIPDTNKLPIRVVVKEQVEISGSHLGSISANSISIESANILFAKNTISNIDTYGIKLRSNKFLFLENIVQRISENGFDVVSRTVEISQNDWKSINGKAFAGIKPGHKSNDFEVAVRYSYSFTQNKVAELAMGGLHPNFTLYNDVGAKITLGGNELPCSNCTHLPWNPSNLELMKGFYDQLVLSAENVCIENGNCSLPLVLSLSSRGACSNESKICPSTVTTTEVPEISTDTSTSTKTTDKVTEQQTTPATTSTQSIKLDAMVVAVGTSSGKTTVISSIVCAVIMLILGVVGFTAYSRGYCRRKNLYRNDNDKLMEDFQEHSILQDS